jgi:hypothetical protein
MNHRHKRRRGQGTWTGFGAISRDRQVHPLLTGACGDIGNGNLHPCRCWPPARAGRRRGRSPLPLALTGICPKFGEANTPVREARGSQRVTRRVQGHKRSSCRGSFSKFGPGSDPATREQNQSAARALPAKAEPGQNQQETSAYPGTAPRVNSDGAELAALGCRPKSPPFHGWPQDPPASGHPSTRTTDGGGHGQPRRLKGHPLPGPPEPTVLTFILWEQGRH